MRERMLARRKALGMTQQAFADALHISRSNIATYETREGCLSDPVITLISRTFNVNETWLRTGEGQMFNEVTRDERIAEFVGEALNGKSDSIKRRMISVLSRMNDDDWSAMGHFAELLLEERGDKKED